MKYILLIGDGIHDLASQPGTQVQGQLGAQNDPLLVCPGVDGSCGVAC